MKSQAVMEADTLLDFFNIWAQEKPSKIAYTFLGAEGEEQNRITYAELKAKALSIAAALNKRGASGERVVLFFHPGLEFICAFW
jgi:acyl-CoA synthetase (AMP-forming)/AMP-acid ligase II